MFSVALPNKKRHSQNTPTLPSPRIASSLAALRFRPSLIGGQLGVRNPICYPGERKPREKVVTYFGGLE